ncbi:MAG: hypothetical protein ABUL63_02390, partial [Acidobacteriota bacterium]
MPSSAPRADRGGGHTVLALASPLLAVCLGLLYVSDLAHHPLLTLSLLGSAFLWLPAAAARLENAG